MTEWLSQSVSDKASYREASLLKKKGKSMFCLFRNSYPDAEKVAVFDVLNAAWDRFEKWKLVLKVFL